MMRNSTIFAGLFFAAACSPASAQNESAADSSRSESTDYNKIEQPEPTPAAIRGLWAESLKDCADQYATSRMMVGSNWISFYESYGLMQISTPAGIPDLRESLAVHFIMSGEGSTWSNEIVFGWGRGKPDELFLIEAKTSESMNRERKRDRYVRCAK